MSTTWEQIETQAMTYIKNDLSLDWDMANRLAVYYNRMAGYMKAAIPLFNRPPEMMLKLRDYTEPLFDDLAYTIPNVSTFPLTVETDMVGYDICNCGAITEDEYGNIAYQPIEVTSYDPDTGNVVIPKVSYRELQFDFYKSGTFSADLNGTEINILAFAIYDVWEHRFDNDALERKSKVRDSSFTTISEASQTTAATLRQKEVDAQLFSMMRAYQENLAVLAVKRLI